METTVENYLDPEVSESNILSNIDKIQILIDLSKIWYAGSCFEAELAVQDIRNVWIKSPGSYKRKIIAVNKLIMFYIIILTIYIIQLCFWVNGKLLEEFINIILRSRDKSQMVIGLGLVAVVILLVYVIGALCPEPWDVCDRQMQ